MSTSLHFFLFYSHHNFRFDGTFHSAREAGALNMQNNDSLAHSTHNILEQSSNSNGQFYFEYFEGASQHYGKGMTFLDSFDQDKYSEERKSNLYYPFSSRADWEMALCLHGSGLSLSKIDEILELEIVSLNKFVLAFSS